MEVHGAVLDLDDDVVGEPAVQREEFLHGLVGPVRAGRAVDEGAPHHDAAVRSQRLGQHVGAVGVGASVVLRAGLAFGIGLDEEAAEIRDGGIDLGRLVLPPGADLRVERVAALQAAQGDGGVPLDGEVGADAVVAQDLGDLRHAGDVLLVKDEGVGIDVVEHGAVQAHRGAELAVLADARLRNFGGGPFPHRFPGIAALDGVVQVVPVVEQAQVVERGFLQVDAGPGLAKHFRALQGVNAVAQAGFGAGVHVACAVVVVDVELFGGELRGRVGLDGGENLGVGAGGSHPQGGAVLVDGTGRGAGAQQQGRGGKGEQGGFVHIILCFTFLR